MPDERPRSVSSVIFTIHSYTGRLSTDRFTNNDLSFTDSLHDSSDTVQTVFKGYQRTTVVMRGSRKLCQRGPTLFLV